MAICLKTSDFKTIKAVMTTAGKGIEAWPWSLDAKAILVKFNRFH
jgi:hypothetical protein